MQCTLGEGPDGNGDYGSASEEFFLADARTRGTPKRGVGAFHSAVRERLDRVERELLQSRWRSLPHPRQLSLRHTPRLGELRAGLAAIEQGARHPGVRCRTQPVARWLRQSPTQADRYEQIMCGVCACWAAAMWSAACTCMSRCPIPPAEFDLMNRLLPFLPVLLALSTSSPFWQGRPTGLAGYRLCAFGEMPRTGLPDLFAGAERL